jgi:lipopolysaccharide export system protein LptC
MTSMPLRPPAFPPNRPPRSAMPARTAHWARAMANNPYSRRVAILKRLLPAIGLGLLLMVAVWPRLAPLLERLRFKIPAIDLREARELRMLNPRYLGTDRENRPFVVTAKVGQQVPDRPDLMSLEAPQANLKAHSGADIVVTAATGIYQSKAQVLDLFGDVTLIHQNGTHFVTDTARVNVHDNSAQGDDPVVGHGPSGDIKAQGFRILDKGDTVVFTGQSDLALTGARPAATKSVPPALPPAVAREAATLEAKAKPALAAAAVKTGKPAAPAHRLPAPVRARRVAAHPHPTAHPIPHRVSRAPVHKAGAT